MSAKRLLVAMLTCLLTACEQAPAPSNGFAGLGQDAADFAQVERGRPLVFPLDEGAHDGYRIEWWYVTANLTDAQGREWGVQWTLFRSALRPGPEQAGWQSPNLWMGHAGLTSPFGHHHAERLARGGIGQAGVVAEPFNAWIDDWSLRAEPGTQPLLRMQAHGEAFSYDLRLHSEGPRVLHGDQGYSEKSGKGQASSYYSLPFLRVEGQVEVDGQRYPVRGQAWLDREWSSQPLAADQQGWDWFSLHLADGAKLMLFQVRQADGAHYRAGTWISATGQVQALRGEQISLQPLGHTRQAGGQQVPTRWRVQVAEHGVDVEVDAIEPNAWMGTTFPYWEGPVRLHGQPGGRGYLEMTGY
ncbi:MAG: iron ABC transporter permease [Gammaproteobacteria bacterium]|nr:iron ABC transporter permease [Gammaproteobacteria bacterium]MBU2140290.1 iron ABC transporter permease [Gammaproteobacteria bacterium]MBU2217155.1 iron ABC transporter permease [Gammaproteobacteria bacterium]MBU2323837.1 iron ABC transporter permease [Gammaproteobacteria bacterium]